MQVSIVAFNAAEYHAALSAKFPDINYHLADSKVDFAPEIYDSDVIIFFGTQGSDVLYRQCLNLKWIQALGTGVDGITDQQELSRDVIVTNMRGIHGPQCAEMALLLMMTLGRRIVGAVHSQMERSWARQPGSILDGKTVGIFGIGVIGEALAKRCRPFGLNVIGITDHPRDLTDFDRQVPRSDLRDVASELDYLVVLAPATEETRHIINADILAEMKPTAFLINIARGELIDDDALVAALESGAIAGAALDVFHKEPLPDDDPLWSANNLLITPHYAGMVKEYASQALPVIEHNMAAFLAGDASKMLNLVER